MKFIVNQAKLKSLAKRLSTKLILPQTLVLQGDLGSGKTTFTRFLAQEIGILSPVTSPTFSLVQEYYHKNLSFIHADLYRLDKNCNLDLLGFDEYFKLKNCLIIIEWGDKFKDILPKKSLYLHFRYVDEDTREISFPDGFLS